MQTALLSGLFALIGVLIAQGVVLWLARRTEKKRTDPELLKQCAMFSAAAGRFKRDIATKPRNDWDLSSLGSLEEASDSIDIIGTPAIERAAEKVIAIIPLLLDHEKFGVDYNETSSQLFAAHRHFTDAVRIHFGKPPKVYMAVPIITRP
ncbi:hypothetical protein RhoFasGS6_00554 [Rhodococcus fascians]|uniref:hypothetical protein n=1 Tax=Rhodococcoides fascians TaxID=1828 RepID=UPI001427C37B|nr:hypothetical protein [Rhodococcus fascians]